MKRPLPRRSYTAPELVRVAYLAGSGLSSSDIADAIGDTTGLRVRALLSKHGLALLPKTPHEVAFHITISEAAMREAEKIAEVKRLEPRWMVGRVLDVCLKDRTLFLNLLEEVELP